MERFREILSDPLNLLIDRHPSAGCTEHGFVTLHNGIKVPVEGAYAYYGDFSHILVLNRGVHEPLEEFVFQQLLKRIRFTHPSILELGAYWGHYSLWLKHVCPHSRAYLVEPEAENLEAGRFNFANHSEEAEFIQDFVGKGHFSVDQFLSTRQISRLAVLHADIQGFEVEMLEDCQQSLSRQIIDFVCISTHNQKLHQGVIDLLEEHRYRVEISSDFDYETTSFDGLVFASSLRVPPVFEQFKPMGRIEISEATPEQLANYIAAASSFLR